MKSDNYIKRIFSILLSRRPAGRRELGPVKSTVFKTLCYPGASALLFAVVLGLTYQWPAEKIMLSAESKNMANNTTKKTTAQHLKSQILPYSVAAVRQILTTTSLRKADQVAFNEEDVGMNSSWVVMDKVIVIPKVIG